MLSVVRVSVVAPVALSALNVPVTPCGATLKLKLVAPVKPFFAVN